MVGSCFSGEACPYAASHLPGRPSALFSERAPLLRAKGLLEGPLGFHKPEGGQSVNGGGASGSKRPFGAAFPAASGASSPTGRGGAG